MPGDIVQLDFPWSFASDIVQFDFLLDFVWCLFMFKTDISYISLKKLREVIRNTVKNLQYTHMFDVWKTFDITFLLYLNIGRCLYLSHMMLEWISLNSRYQCLKISLDFDLRVKKAVGLLYTQSAISQLIAYDYCNIAPFICRPYSKINFSYSIYLVLIIFIHLFNFSYPFIYVLSKYNFCLIFRVDRSRLLIQRYLKIICFSITKDTS